MIFHIDMSSHYNQKNHSVLAMVSVSIEKHKRDNQIIKGVIIEDPVRSQLLEQYGDTMLHAGLISLLLEGIPQIERVIVCADVLPLEKVFGYATDIHPEMVLGKFRSLIDLRRETGQPRLKSEADALAKRINRAIPKMRNIHRRNPLFDEVDVRIINHKNSEGYKWLEEKLRGIIESNR